MEIENILKLLFVIHVVSAGPFIQDDWLSYKLQHHKTYNDTEDRIRKSIWEDNKRYIERHNLEAAKGLHSYTLGVNSYSDVKHSEFVKSMNGFKVSQSRIQGKEFIPDIDVSSLPNYVNWTAKGYVTEVGNQGACGSCWAFSLLGAIEGQWYKKTGKLVRLSVQDLIDCSTKIGNQGCCGGFMDKTYQYIKDNGGVDTWTSYPYEAKDDNCRFKKQYVGATDTGFVDIKKGSESDLQVAVATVGPVAVAIDATQATFQRYKSGIYEDSKCSSKTVDHTLLVVGYGSLNGKDYWLAKNSWGTTWGMDGYVMIARNKNNMCGIATIASYPTV